MRLYSFLLSTFLFFSFIDYSGAQTITELNATPPAISEPGAMILFTEINLKNKTNDYAVIIYKSPSSKPLNLKGFAFADDSIIKKIESDFIIASGQQILLSFNKPENDTPPYLYTTKKGLTGTTEQIILYDPAGYIADMVCWCNATPTQTEKKDMEKFFTKSGWVSADPFSCINSENITTDESIKRNGLADTDSAADWLSSQKEEGEDGDATTASVKQSTANDLYPVISPLPLQDIEIPKTQKISENSKTKSSTEKKSFINGNLSTELKITEILANPEGTDNGKEWIEIFNNGSKTVNLGNWQLDDTEGGSKPFLIPDTVSIKPGEALALDTKTVKLSLGNQEDEVRLFDFENNLVDQVSYENAPENQSYSLILLIDEKNDLESEEFIWTAKTSPSAINPTYHSFAATIYTPPVFEDDYYFEVYRDDIEETAEIYFNEDVIQAPMAKALLLKDIPIDITAEKIADKRYTLIKYSTGEKITDTQQSANYFFSAVIFIIVCIATIAYLAYKKIRWKKSQSPI